MAQSGSPGDRQDGPDADGGTAQRALRQQALRQLAAQQTQQSAFASTERPAAKAIPSVAPPPSLRPPRRRTHRAAPWLIALGPALAVIAVVAIVLAHALTTRQDTGPGGSTSLAPYITPAADGMVCAADVAWSPQGDEIAVLGYASQCRQPDTAFDHSVGIVNIYMVRTRKLVGTIHLDDAVVRGITPNGPGSSVPAADVTYQGLLWSPDETQLAVSFRVFGHLSGQARPLDALGLFVSDLHGGSTTGLVNAPQGDVHETTASEWSIERSSTTYGGNVVTPALALPPALSYAWMGSSLGPHGPRLSTGTPVAAPPLGPIGNPVGGTSFTIWQPGIALLRAPDAASAAGGPFGFYTTFGAWSPDGRYVVAPRQYPYTLIEGSVSTPPSASALVDPAPPPYAPLRDKGLEAVYRMLVAEKADNATALVGWRPDGAEIAAQRRPASGQTFNTSVVIYDCATGKQIATLQPASVPNHVLQYTSDSPATDFLQWSPDGKQLLVLAPTEGTLTIFGPGQLPR